MDTETVTKSTYAGADWLEAHLQYLRPGTTISEFGKRVADLLGELFYGIYHLDNSTLKRADWSSETYIEISFRPNGLSTYDYDTLSRLVFLAHHLAIRVQANPCNMQYLELMFHPRSREGGYSQRHPFLDEAVANFHKQVKLPEFDESI